MDPQCNGQNLTKEKFYEQLGKCIINAKEMLSLYLVMLMLVLVQTGESWPSVIGKHGVGKMNSNGLNVIRILHSSEPLNNEQNVPAEESTQKYLATSTLKTGIS